MTARSATLHRGLALLFLALPLACSASAESGGGSLDDEAAARARRATSTAVYLDLGKVASGGETTFDVPANALGFNIVLENQQAKSGSFVSIYELRNPAGDRVIAEAGVAGGTAHSMYREGKISFQVPSSDMALRTPIAGRWSAVLVGYDEQGAMSLAVDLRAQLAVQTTSDGAFHGGLLDMHVYVPDGLKVHDPDIEHTVDAISAAEDACIKARVDGFYAGLSSMVGIDRGKVVYHRVPAGYGAVAGDPELRAYFEESKIVGNAPALHVMLTNTLALIPGSDEGSAWGVAAAIGGSAGRTGTGLSGTALSLSAASPASGDALTLLHEAGHFMGLNHTSEMSGRDFDPFADTPQCVGVTQENFHACPDGRDLLFALYYGASNGGVGVYLTPSQTRVMRGAPVYRAYATEATTR